MPREKSMDVRKIVSMSAELVERIRQYRFGKQVNSEAEAIRTLIEKGLDTEGFPAPKGETE